MSTYSPCKFHFRVAHVYEIQNEIHYSTVFTQATLIPCHVPVLSVMTPLTVKTDPQYFPNDGLASLATHCSTRMIGFSARRRTFHVACTVLSLVVYLFHVFCRFTSDDRGNDTPSARRSPLLLLQESPHGELRSDGPSPAAATTLQSAPSAVESSAKRAVVRLERRSLQELLAENTPVSGGKPRRTGDRDQK